MPETIATPHRPPHRNPRRLRRSLAALALSLCVPGSLVLAQPQASMVSVKVETANMRQGPGTGTAVLWQLHHGYPLQVVDRRNTWIKVRDFEGDEGWVSRRLTGRTAHHVVKVPTANLRGGPGTGHRIVGKAEYGELLRTLERRGDWVHVRRADQQKGWIARRLLWGW